MKLTVLFVVVVGANSGLVVEKRAAQEQDLIDAKISGLAH